MFFYNNIVRSLNLDQIFANLKGIVLVAWYHVCLCEKLWNVVLLTWEGRIRKFSYGVGFGLWHIAFIYSRMVRSPKNISIRFFLNSKTAYNCHRSLNKIDLMLVTRHRNIPGDRNADKLVRLRKILQCQGILNLRVCL